MTAQATRRMHRLSGRRLRLTVDARTADPLITLALAGHPAGTSAVRWSDLTVFSHGRPWSLVSGACDGPVRISATASRVRISATISGFQVHDTLSIADERLVLKRRWRCVDAARRDAMALGTRWPGGRGTFEKITLPHVLYNDNPAADPTMLVAHLPRTAGAAVVVEEHRLPIPGINVEWRARDRATYALTMLAKPSTITLASAQPDHAWSLGGIHRGDQVDLVSLSGVVAFNGDKDLIYVNQRQTAPYPGGGYLSFAAGDTLEKTLIIELHRCEAEGRGFRRLVHLGWDVLEPTTTRVVTLDRMVALKARALQSRWRQTPSIGGFAWIPDSKEEGNVYGANPGFLFGWTGQSLRLAWCSIHLGLRTNDRAWFDKAAAVMDSLATAPEVSGISGLPYLYYHLSDEVWRDSRARHVGNRADGWRVSEDQHEQRVSTRMFGESLTDLAECILLLRRHALPVHDRWMDLLRRMTAFLRSPKRLTSAGIFPIWFAPDGTVEQGLVAAGGAPCVVALLAAAEVLDDAPLRNHAQRLVHRYDREFSRTFRRPFARSTLDAACEDKEAGIYCFLAAYRAYLATGDAVFAEQARVAGEWISTFVYFWNVGFRKGSICSEEGFSSTFWPGVSVQNMHLDVFFPAFEIADLGRRLRDPMLVGIGRGVMSAWTHGMCLRTGHWGFPTPGEQGEQFFQTNWGLSIDHWRGGSNCWNPAWIIALVLQAALCFTAEKQNASTRGRTPTTRRRR